MTTTDDRVLNLCRVLKGFDQGEELQLADYLAADPRLISLANVPAGRRCWCRGDVDAKPGAKLGQDDIRLAR